MKSFDRLIKKETIIYSKSMAFGIIYGAVSGYLFYNNVYISIIFSFVFLGIYFIKAKKEVKKISLEIQEEDFYNFLISLSESIGAGLNMKNALKSSVKEIREGIILEEINIILRQIMMNHTLKEAFLSFKKNTKSNEIKKWINIILISYSKGANLSKAIKNNKDMIVMLKRTKKEASSILARQKMNIFIMKIIPIFIIFLITSSASDFALPLYEKNGRIVMTCVFFSILLADYISERMIRIE